MKKLLSFLLICAVLSGCAASGCSRNAEENSVAALEVTLLETGYSGETVRFMHPYGYSVEAPANFKARDELLELELRLEREDCVIEAIPQFLSEGVSNKEYSGYSNGFLKNTELHVLDSQRELKLAGNDALLTLFHREKAGGDDKNYYAIADIYLGNTVYTLIIKANRALSELDFDYMSVLDSFQSGEIHNSVGTATVFKNERRSAMNAETAALYRDYFADGADFHWGLYYHRQPVDGMEKFEALEEKVGRVDMALLYTEIYDEYDPYMVYGGLVNAYNSGKICEVTLQLDIDSDESDVYEVLRGEHDDFLYAYARDIVRFGHPVLLRPFNEMNGEWCNYSGYRTARDPDVYLRLYKYVRRIFDEAGAENVIWVWNPNEVSYPNFNWNHMLLYYPGDEYVDVVGLSGYNTGTGIEGEVWRSFSEIYDGYYEYMRDTFNKPLMIAEFGCAKEGGDKLEWMRQMFSDLREKYPEIRAAVWLHERDKNKTTGETTRSFFLDDTPGLPELFKAEREK